MTSSISSFQKEQRGTAVLSTLWTVCWYQQDQVQWLLPGEGYHVYVKIMVWLLTSSLLGLSSSPPRDSVT